MAKYKVLASFLDVENNDKRIEEGSIIDITVGRYEQMTERAFRYGGIEMFLETVSDDEVTSSKRKKETTK